jgi:hypothetical protein
VIKDLRVEAQASSDTLIQPLTRSGDVTSLPFPQAYNPSRSSSAPGSTYLGLVCSYFHLGSTPGMPPRRLLSFLYCRGGYEWFRPYALHKRFPSNQFSLQNWLFNQSGGAHLFRLCGSTQPVLHSIILIDTSITLLKLERRKL